MVKYSHVYSYRSFIICVALVWMVGLQPILGQGRTRIQLQSDENQKIRSAAEESVSSVLTEFNRARFYDRRPDLSGLPVTKQGQEDIFNRWDEAPFFCNQTALTRRLIQEGNEAYKIRKIPLIVG